MPTLLSNFVNQLVPGLGLGSAATSGLCTFGNITATQAAALQHQQAVIMQQAANQFYITSGTSSTTWSSTTITDDTDCFIVGGDGSIKVLDGEARKVELPDGTIIDVKANGSYEIKDKDAKIVYRASRMRDFNPFINVSDRLEEFIEFCGQYGVRQDEMMNLPLNLFIGWLVVQAAKADKEPEPDVKLLPDLRKHTCPPKCPSCGKWVSPKLKAQKLEFCAPKCYEIYFIRQRPQLACLP